MIITVGTFQIELTGAVTHERYQQVIKLALLTNELKDTDHLIIAATAQANGNEIKRLRSKRQRLEGRIEQQKALVHNQTKRCDVSNNSRSG